MNIFLLIFTTFIFNQLLGSPMDINELNKKCYNARAEYWNRLPFADFLPEAIVKAHNPKNGFKAIDIGSGTGQLALWLSKRGYEILCLDPSEEMVRRTKSMGLPTLQLTLQEFLPTEKYDLVLAILSLIHIPKSDLPEQIDKIAGMLNPQGIFALSMIEGVGEGVGETSSKYPRFFAYYTREEILALAKKHFVLVEEWKNSGPITYLSFIFRKDS